MPRFAGLAVETEKLSARSKWIVQSLTGAAPASPESDAARQPKTARAGNEEGAQGEECCGVWPRGCAFF